MDSIKLCLCGCGEAVTRRYRPGHDARHKAALVNACRLATTPWTRECAIRTLESAGWLGYCDLELLRTHPIRNHQRQVRIHLLDARHWIVDPTGCHHARHNCATLTRLARSAGQVHPITRLARPSFVTIVDNDAERMTTLAQGLDLCGNCAIDWTLDEVAETAEVRKQEYLLALDCEGLTNHRQRKPARPVPARVTLSEWAAPRGPAHHMPPPNLNPTS